MRKQLLCTVILAYASFGVWAASGNADFYPSKPIRIIVGSPAGSPDDVLARIIGAKLTERFGQPVIVDNRLGVGGNFAAGIVAHANPDGYTLMSVPVTPLTASPSLFRKLGYDLLKDFSYVSLLSTSASALIVHPSIPARSVAELVALARSKPKVIRYASSGVATGTHLSMELLQSRTGMELLHIPYRGGAAIMTALVGGEVEIAFAAVTPAIPMITAKRVNALAVSSAKRIRVLPEVPTVAESGVPGFDVTFRYGILAPTGTPAAVVKLLNAELRNIAQMDDVKAKFATQGFEAAGSTPNEFRAIVEAEMAQWARVIKDAGITAN